MIIMHSGQTGVERGADRAARTIDLPVEGVCSFERRDELGPLPLEIQTNLKPCSRKGARMAIHETLNLSNALVIAIPSVTKANAVAGVEWLRRLARGLGVPHWVVDPSSNLDEIAIRIRVIADPHPLRVLITGPRFTRWEAGERLGFRMVASLAIDEDLCPTRVMQRASTEEVGL